MRHSKEKLTPKQIEYYQYCIEQERLKAIFFNSCPLLKYDSKKGELVKIER
jgi:hypothetical protein